MIAFDAMEPAQMFVGGGTFVSNGVFFPGTAVFDGTDLQGLPLQVEKGQDIELTNLDYGDIANCHQLTSFKRKGGRPVFNSKRLCAPGESAIVLMGRAKPGIYEAYCPVHTGYRFDLLAGYRFLRLDDRVGVVADGLTLALAGILLATSAATAGAL